MYSAHDFEDFILSLTKPISSVYQCRRFQMQVVEQKRRGLVRGVARHIPYPGERGRDPALITCGTAAKQKGTPERRG